MKPITFGDKKKFAVEIEFCSDPDAGKFALPEDGLSWGRLDLWVDGRNLCDPGGVTWYLLPLFEWFVANWDAIFHESKLPRVSNNKGFPSRLPDDEDSAWVLRDRDMRRLPYLKDDEADLLEESWHTWSLRHGIRSAAEGGIFPDILILRHGEDVLFSWGPPPDAGMPDGFHFEYERGEALLPLKSVCIPLFQAMQESVHILLDKSKIASPASEGQSRLIALRENIESLKNVSREERLIWLSGLARTREEARTRLHALKGRLREKFAFFALEGLSGTDLALEGSSLATMMYGSVAPEIGEADVFRLAESVLDLPPSDVEVQRILCDSLSEHEPYLQGYEMAESLHRKLGADMSVPRAVEIEAIVDEMGIRVDSIRLDDTGIMGVAVVRPGCAPSILINSSYERNGMPQGRRFTIAHELCHLLRDQERGRPLAIASGPWAPSVVEKRANAFAAMFLMPKEMLEILYREISDDSLSDRVSECLNTGRTAARKHLENLGFLPAEEMA